MGFRNKAPISTAYTHASAQLVIGEDIREVIFSLSFLSGSTSPPQSKAERFRFSSLDPRRPPDSADGNLDLLIEQRWFQHLSSLLENVAITKRWKSGYWYKWLESVALFAEYDPKVHDHIDPDILVAEDEEDENFNWIPEAEPSESDYDANDPSWPVVGSPPFTKDARRELPAFHDQDHQGGNSEGKPFLAGAPSWAEKLPEHWCLPEVLHALA